MTKVKVTDTLPEPVDELTIRVVARDETGQERTVETRHITAEEEETIERAEGAMEDTPTGSTTITDPPVPLATLYERLEQRWGLAHGPAGEARAKPVVWATGSLEVEHLVTRVKTLADVPPGEPFSLGPPQPAIHDFPLMQVYKAARTMRQAWWDLHGITHRLDQAIEYCQQMYKTKFLYKDRTKDQRFDAVLATLEANEGVYQNALACRYASLDSLVQLAPADPQPQLGRQDAEDLEHPSPRTKAQAQVHLVYGPLSTEEVLDDLVCYYAGLQADRPDNIDNTDWQTPRGLPVEESIQDDIEAMLARRVDWYATVQKHLHQQTQAVQQHYQSLVALLASVEQAIASHPTSTQDAIPSPDPAVMGADPGTTLAWLAQQQHAIWAAWMQHQLKVSVRLPDGQVVLPAHLVRRWYRQASTPYTHLPEAEQASDQQVIHDFLGGLVQNTPSV